ncbi:hypothetical protein JRQ81_020175 [Phrynocephalus forsythii]|uniref:exo-alpha-sialidase n=1 Tax=Phrynocephalus forsythii TaxID=171643 RepID=A0A9Q1AYP2_9SAUR|nr:hypothetical protein JRQ81_020175 [Phrynocephalus forsythii]
MTATLPKYRTMNPCPVYEKKSGTVFLFFICVLDHESVRRQIMTGRNAVRLCYISSQDGGHTWSPATDLTEQVIEENLRSWATFAVGPGHGVQLSSGRLVVPAYAYHIHRRCFPCVAFCCTTPHCFTFYSDDGGQSWARGQLLETLRATECQVSEVMCRDGHQVLYINARSPCWDRCRAEAFSRDDGRHFQESSLCRELCEPPSGCQGSVVSFTPPPASSDLDRKEDVGDQSCLLGIHGTSASPNSATSWLIFSHPTSRRKRTDLGIYLNTSPLEKGCWRKPWLLNKGPSGYSDLAVCEEAETLMFGCMFECGVSSAYEEIAFRLFTNAELLRHTRDCCSERFPSSDGRLPDVEQGGWERQESGWALLAWTSLFSAPRLREGLAATDAVGEKKAGSKRQRRPCPTGKAVMQSLRVALLFLGALGWGCAETYTSMQSIDQALATERSLLQSLHAYLEEEARRLSDLQRFYTKIQTLHREVGSSVANPLSAFTLIKRLQSDWLNVVHSTEANENLRALQKAYQSLEEVLPAFGDLEGAARAMMRLQDVYSLSVKELAKGRFRKSSSAHLPDVYSPGHDFLLSADDCFHIGKVAYEMEDYYHSIPWLEEAVTLFRGSYGNWNTEDEGSLEDALDHLAFSYFKAGNISHALSLSQEFLHYDPSNKRVARNILKYEKLLTAKPGSGNGAPTLQRPNVTHLETRDVYEALCQNLGSQATGYQLPSLSCSYETNGDPLLLLQPLKKEILHQRPYLALFHHFVSDSEAEKIKALAAPWWPTSGFMNTARSSDGPAAPAWKTSPPEGCGASGDLPKEGGPWQRAGDETPEHFVCLPS